MRMTSTGAFPRAFAAARPPKPPPTITTRGAFDFRSSAPLIELRLASFINPFLKLLRQEISENLGFSRGLLTRRVSTRRVDLNQYLDNCVAALAMTGFSATNGRALIKRARN